MSINEEMLSAYLDGELSAEDVAKLEDVLARDTALQGELAALIEADQAAHEDFAATARGASAGRLAWRNRWSHCGT